MPAIFSKCVGQFRILFYYNCLKGPYSGYYWCIRQTEQISLYS